MRNLFFLASAAMIAATIGCSRGPAPTAPSRAVVGPPADIVGTPASTTPALFGASAVDFARCLQGAADTACLSGTRVGAQAVTGAAATIPGSPMNLATWSNGSSVTLTWSAPASGDATGYVIEAGSAPGLANLANFMTGSTATMFTAAGVGNGTYYVRVRAQNAAGTSAASNESVLVVGPGACMSAPGQPGPLAITSSGSTVTLSWDVPDGGCAPTSYLLQAGSSPGASDLANANVGNTTSYVATGVGNGTYYVRVRGLNAFGQSAASNEVVVTVSGEPSPSPSPSPSPTSTTRWVGVSPEGMVVLDNPQAQCPGEFDLQLDLTVSGGAVTGTALTRLRKTIGAQCQDVLGEIATWGLMDLRVGSDTISFAMGSGGSHRFSGTFTDRRMTGTFSITHTVPRATIQTGSFAVNRQ